MGPRPTFECALCGLSQPGKDIPEHLCPHGVSCHLRGYCPQCRAGLKDRLLSEAKTKATLDMWTEIFETLDSCAK